jgi:hypothetical protein
MRTRNNPRHPSSNKKSSCMLYFVEFKKFYGNYPALKIPDFNIEPGIYWVKALC